MGRFNFGVVLVVIAALVFSTGAFFVKVAGLPPEVITAWRFLIPVVVVSLLRPSLWKQLIGSPNRVLVAASVLSFLRVALWVVGIRMAPMSKAVVVLYTWPLIFTLLGFLFLGEPVRYRALLGVVLGFTGVLIMGLDPSVLSDRQQLLGLCLMLCVALLNGVNYALFKGQLRSRGPDEVLMYDNLVGALLLSPFLFSSVGDISMRSMVAVGCYAGLVGTLGYFIMYAGLKRVRPATASALSYLEVAAGAVLGVVAFHEPVGIRMILGAVCIIVAASLVRTRDA